MVIYFLLSLPHGHGKSCQLFRRSSLFPPAPWGDLLSSFLWFCSLSWPPCSSRPSLVAVFSRLGGGPVPRVQRGTRVCCSLALTLTPDRVEGQRQQSAGSRRAGSAGRRERAISAVTGDCPAQPSMHRGDRIAVCRPCFPATMGGSSGRRALECPVSGGGFRDLAHVLAVGETGSQGLSSRRFLCCSFSCCFDVLAVCNNLGISNAVLRACFFSFPTHHPGGPVPRVPRGTRVCCSMALTLTPDRVEGQRQQ
jgi:hypothetical protein